MAALRVLGIVILAAGCTPSLHDTIGCGDMDRVRQMLQENPALVSDANELGKQPLQYAVMYAQKDAMEALEAAGADLNAADNTGLTALHVAAMLGARGPLRWLLAHGANPMARDQFGDLASHTAAIYGQDAVLPILKDYGDPLDLPNTAGLTPAELALKYRHRKTAAAIKQLIGVQPAAR